MNLSNEQVRTAYESGINDLLDGEYLGGPDHKFNFLLPLAVATARSGGKMEPHEFYPSFDDLTAVEEHGVLKILECLSLGSDDVIDHMVKNPLIQGGVIFIQDMAEKHNGEYIDRSIMSEWSPAEIRPLYLIPEAAVTVLQVSMDKKNGTGQKGEAEGEDADPGIHRWRRADDHPMAVGGTRTRSLARNCAGFQL